MVVTRERGAGWRWDACQGVSSSTIAHDSTPTVLLTHFWAQLRLMKWVIESSLVAVTDEAEKQQLCGSSTTVTRWKGAGWSKRRLFIASATTLRVYDHSLPHNWLATGDMEGE
ncbi:unnamed protein product [Spirodela intermedia]|uniref:Uncharacterized protein n=1 Tax=Spirodela intermedia TaxID=51605 RepID=A0A7I8IG33_SPIIN|nr:unnamed protein product [Spirodela intermedia]CAA6656591.1 unnamed protein product [Spirodela intermedia]